MIISSVRLPILVRDVSRVLAVPGLQRGAGVAALVEQV
jgi:hypothetical protein